MRTDKESGKEKRVGRYRGVEKGGGFGGGSVVPCGPRAVDSCNEASDWLTMRQANI